jgi:hypothetical protein
MKELEEAPRRKYSVFIALIVVLSGRVRGVLIYFRACPVSILAEVANPIIRNIMLLNFLAPKSFRENNATHKLVNSIAKLSTTDQNEPPGKKKRQKNDTKRQSFAFYIWHTLWCQAGKKRLGVSNAYCFEWRLLEESSNRFARLVSGGTVMIGLGVQTYK